MAPEIYILTADRIMATARKTGYTFNEIRKLYFQGQDRAETVVVRAGPRFLQWMFVNHRDLENPETKAYLEDETNWDYYSEGA